MVAREPRAQGGPYHFRHVELHNRYGPVVRVSPGELSLIGAQTRLDIMARPQKDELAKDFRYFGENLMDGYGLLTAPRDVHQRMRRIFSHAFSSSSLQKQAKLIVASHVNIMINKMVEVCQTDGMLDLGDMLNFLIYDVITQVAVGESLKLLETGENIPWMRIMLTTRKFVVIRAVFLGLPGLGPLLETLTTGPMKRRINEHNRLSRDMVKRRLTRKAFGNTDVWSFVLDKEGTEEGLSMEEMNTNGVMLPLAGESPAVVLSGLLYTLLSNPALHAMLTREIRTTFANSGAITADAVSGMTYLNAVIQEGMRIYPPGPVGAGRFAPAQGVEIAGEHIPAGTLMTWNIFAASMSPAHFHRPRDFIPERWLETRDPVFDADCRKTHEPFGRGPHSCIGKHLAMLEMKLVLAKVLWHFDIELCSGMGGWLDRQASYMAWERRPLMVKISEAGMLN